MFARSILSPVGLVLIGLGVIWSMVAFIREDARRDLVLELENQSNKGRIEIIEGTRDVSDEISNLETDALERALCERLRADCSD